MAPSVFNTMSLCLLMTTVQIQSANETYLYLVVKEPKSSFNRTTIEPFQRKLSILDRTFNSTGCSYHLIEIAGSYCHYDLGSGNCLLQAFIQNALYSKSNSYKPKENMVGIVSTGYHTDSVIVSALLSRMNITIPLMCTSLMSNTATGHGIFYMSSSSSVIVDTFLHLLKQFNWTRIGVVSDHSDSYFSQTTNLLLKKAKTRNITISSYYELERFDHNNYDYIVKHTELLNSKIIFLSVNCHKAGLIFHAAYVDNLTWPEYAWIVHSVEGYKLKQRFSPQLLEGILFINQDFATKKNLSALGSAGSMDIVLPNSIQANNLLFDAVHAILKADVCNEKITHIEINGTTGTILFTNNHVKRNVRITQMKDGVEILQATFDTNSNRLNLAESFSRGVLPNDEIPLRRSPQIPVGLAAAEITFGIVFNTIVLVLYSFYRNEKEIKATSVSLSMLIFIGCYLILLFLMLLMIESNLKHDNTIKNSNILCITLIIMAEWNWTPSSFDIYYTTCQNVKNLSHLQYIRKGQ